MDLTELRDRVMRRVGRQNVDEVDAEINFVQRTYLQPDARIEESFEYETTELNDEVDAPNDLYLLHYVRDTTNYAVGTDIPLVSGHRSDMTGARLVDGKIQLLGLTAGRTLLIVYHKMLPDLEPGGVTTPIIPEQWHDLYWLGASAQFAPQVYADLFFDRLTAFRMERIQKANPHGARLSVRGWW